MTYVVKKILSLHLVSYYLASNVNEISVKLSLVHKMPEMKISDCLVAFEVYMSNNI